MPNNVVVKNKEFVMPAGRPKGSENIKTKQWGKIANYMLDKGSKRMLEIMGGMEDKEFADTYLKLIQYFRPRMQSTQLKSEGTTTIHVVSEKELLDKV